MVEREDDIFKNAYIIGESYWGTATAKSVTREVITKGKRATGTIMYIIYGHATDSVKMRVLILESEASRI